MPDTLQSALNPVTGLAKRLMTGLRAQPLLLLALPAAIIAPPVTAFAEAVSVAAPFAAETAPKVSPFDYARSGGKAERAADAKAADPAGSKVIGGQKAAEGAWPWQVALTIAGQQVNTSSQFCGGSLVMDQWVLTAAHCVRHMDDEGEGVDLLPDDFSIVAGTNRLDGSGDVIAVEEIFIHPSYDVNDLDYDIALVKLARRPLVPYRTIEIPDADYGNILREPGITTVVTGWGLQNGGEPPVELQQAQIQMMDRDLCNQIMIEAMAEDAIEGFVYAAQVMALREEQALPIWEALVEAAPMPLSENMICSGTFEGGKTSCNGDSGGPLVVPLQNGSYIQAGIVSWGLSSESGYGCDETAQFSTYVDVSRFVPWLNEVVIANQ